MLDLIIIFFLGRSFYQLAQEHDKNPWPYAILAGVIYYATAFCTGIGLALVSGVESIDSTFFTIMAVLLALIFALLMCALTYRLLENRWKKAPKPPLGGNILDDEMI